MISLDFLKDLNTSNYKYDNIDVYYINKYNKVDTNN